MSTSAIEAHIMTTASAALAAYAAQHCGLLVNEVIDDEKQPLADALVDAELKVQFTAGRAARA